MKNRIVILAMTLTLVACKKGHGPDVVLTGKLTDCPANSVCSYNYYDHADFSTSNPKVFAGQNTVFSYSSVNNNICGLTTSLIFKAPEGLELFEITSNQIASGQIVGNYMSCPCCDDIVLFKPIGGEIKGERTDNTHWLINATVVFGTEPTNPTDTLTVNQYFTVQNLQ